jgi:hypothetical protein
MRFTDPDGMWPDGPGGFPNPFASAMSGLKSFATEAYGQVKNFVNGGWKNVAACTDLNDATVIATTLTRGSDAININGTQATTLDKVAAVVGLAIPVASGSAVKKIVENALDGASRETRVTNRLREGAGEILEQKTIYGADGKRAIASDGKGRRLDQVRVENGTATEVFETTSPTEALRSRKVQQVSRGDELMNTGGTYIKGNNGEKIPFKKDIETQVVNK